MKTKTTKCHFKNWLKDWDEKINSLEGRKAKEILEERIKRNISRIDIFLNETDEKAMSKYSDPTEKAKALIKNQDRNFYKSLRSVRDDLTVILFEAGRIYEVQNRLVSENFELRTRK